MTLTKKIYYFFSYKRSVISRAFYFKVIPFAIKHNWFFLMAILIRFGLARCGFGRKDPETKKRYRVLFLNKSVFIEDVLNGLKPYGTFDLYMLDRNVIKAIVSYFFPYSVLDNTYKSDDPQMIKAKQDVRDFLNDFLPVFLKLFPIDAMITGNIVYWAEQELAGVLDKLGVSFIACHKESVQAPGISQGLIEARQKGNDPFQGTMALVYNRKTYDQLVDYNMVPKDRIAIIGMPRLDRFHRSRLSLDGPTKQKQALVLHISLISQLKILLDESHPDKWEKISQKTYETLFNVANERKDFSFVIKYKPTDQNQIEDMMAHLSEDVPDNVRFTCGDDLLTLLEESSVVIGHNTTAIFESIAAGKTCLVPHFEEAILDRFKDHLLEYGPGVERVPSPEALRTRLIECLENPKHRKEFSEEISQSLVTWVGNLDGQSSKRLEQGILLAIKAKQRNEPMPLTKIGIA